MSNYDALRVMREAQFEAKAKRALGAARSEPAATKTEPVTKPVVTPVVTPAVMRKPKRDRAAYMRDYRSRKIPAEKPQEAK
jgi:hypothetical protein